MGSKLRWYLFGVLSRLQFSLLPTLKAERERQDGQLCSECKSLFRNMVCKGDWESSFKVDLENSWRCNLCTLILHQLSEQTLRKLHDVQAQYAYFEGRGYALLRLGFIKTTFYFRWIGQSGYIQQEEVELHWIPREIAEEESIFHNIGPWTDSEANWALAKKWYIRCQRSHLCGINSRYELPTRLIRITFPNQKVKLQLCLSSDLLPGTTYCTLSHCWGTEPFYTLNRRRLNSFQRSIPVNRLTRTFQEAIEAARRFKIMFIWIDSLCIVQDDVEDWKRESATMCNVYAGSAINFAATAAPQGNWGLFSRRDPQVIKPCTVQMDVPGRSGGLYECVADSHWRLGVEDSPLASRGWVLQERLLAPRTLHFGKFQWFWECGEGRCCETFPNGLPPKPRNHSRDGGFLCKTIEDPGKLWRLAIESYTRACLSHEEDKLVAVSGICRFVKNISNDEYAAGLWLDNMELQLLWSIPDHTGRSTICRPRNYRAPTWSWASLDGPVIWDGPINWERNLPSTSPIASSKSSGSSLKSSVYQDQYTLMVKVLGVKIELASEDPFGEIKAAMLTLQCSPLLASRIELSLGPGQTEPEPHFMVGGMEVFGAGCDIKSEEPKDGERVYLLPVCETHGRFLFGLILIPIPNVHGQYRRIGDWAHDQEEYGRLRSSGRACQDTFYQGAAEYVRDAGPRNIISII